MPISIKNRLLLLSLLPVLILSLALYLTFTSQTKGLVDSQLEMVDERVTNIKRNELRRYMDMTYSSIQHIYESGGSMEDALPILRNLKYGDHGYVFGYTGNGTRVVQGQSEKGLGENFYDLQDAKGNYLIRGLLEAGQSGGGYFTYWFPKPGSDVAEPKQSYAIYLDRWDLMLGTGFYFDDVGGVLGRLAEAGAEELDSTQVFFAGIASVAALTAVIIGYFISLTISRPIASISKSVENLSSGEADLTQRVEVGDRFELGALANHINTFIGTLAELVGDTKANAERTSESARAISNHNSALSELVDEQDSETEQVASAVTEMTTAANEISQSATGAAGSASSAAKETAQAKQIIVNAAAEMNALNNNIGVSAHEVEELGRGVDKISSVLEVINTIADQTNLLALNAAIEAARAGEHGRGFSVVAEEVRSLASKTTASTEEIDQMIAALKDKATASVSSIRESSNRSKTALDSNNEAVTSIESIVASIDDINQRNEQVASASEEQTSVCDEITERLVIISDKSKQTSEKGRESTVSAETMSANAQALQDLVERFKTS